MAVRPGRSSCSTRPAIAAQAEVIQRGWPQLAGHGQKLIHRLMREPAGLLDFRRQPRGLGAGRLEPQQHAGQRLVDLVVEVAGDPGRSSSWAASAAFELRRRSASRRRIILRKASPSRSASSVSATPSIQAGRLAPGWPGRPSPFR